MIPELVKYRVAAAPELGPVAAPLYEYVLAANGLFLRAEREGLAATVPVSACEVRGLFPVNPGVRLAYPRVAAARLSAVFKLARRAAQFQPRESLFYFLWEKERGRWRLHLPPQTRRPDSVEPAADADRSHYEKAVIEIHSHHDMPAFFSETDDRDEQGFRLYGVIGRINYVPEIRLRVGVYGYHYEIPANQVFELPPDVRDCVKGASVET